WLETKGHVLLNAAKRPVALVGTVADVTDRMKMNLALAESQHRFKLLAENLPGIVYLVKYDEQFTPLYLSDAIEALTGIPKHRFIDGELMVGDLCDPEDKKRIQEEIDLAVEDGTSYHLFYRLQNASGEWRWIEEFGVAIREENEILLEGFLHDITERRHDEMVLAHQAAEMTALYETSVVLTSTRDLKVLLDTIVERAAVLLGMEMGLLSLVSNDGQMIEFVAGYNRPMSDSSTHIQIPIGQGIAGIIAQTGQTLIIPNYEEWEGRIDLPSPTPIGRTLGVPLKYNDEVIGAISVFNQEPGDFTQEQVRVLSLFATYAAVSIQNFRFFEQEQRQREISDILRNVGLVVHSSLDLNQVFDRILSELDKVVPYDGAHILLLESADYVRIVVSRRVYQQINLLGELIPIKEIPLARKVLQDQQPWLVPDALQEPRFIGSYRGSEPVRSLILLPLVDHGESIGVLMVLSYEPFTYTADDMNIAFQFSQQVVMAIVNARLLEQERVYSAELEARVAARTRELAQAKEAAESANRAKSAFLAHMSHELRTPLTAIMGFTQILMLSDSLTQEEQENLRIVNQSSQHLLSVINDVLDMSKIESGKVILSPHDFDLGQMLQKLEDMFSLRATRKNLHFVINKNLEMPQFIQADEQKLLQVLINLLSNAFKFTEEGQVELTIIAQEQANQRLSLRFEVADTGPGIPAAHMEKLFQPFVQINPLSRSKPGTGLGLAISQEFVQLMGGQLMAQSIEGQGSVFSFAIEVPLLEGASQPLILSRTASGLAANQLTYRILVIDWPQGVERFFGSLEPLGFAVKTADSGEGALHILETWFPHVIFVALQRFCETDLAVLEQIKRLAADQKAIFIPLIDQLDDVSELATILDDCETVLVKPFTEQRIFDTLQRYLNIQFVYANHAHDVVMSGETSIFKPIDVNHLPQSWLDKMYQAAVRSDQGQMLLLITQIEDEAPSAAAYFKQLVTTFSTRTILKLT
ncbi:MAG: GAF domain-containing protein, partial [Anaerolineales bacterium]|nr:GAF domain-containing protein [Anaerolineales bacterium]